MVYKAYRSYCLAGTGDFRRRRSPYPSPLRRLFAPAPGCPGESRRLYPVASPGRGGAGIHPGPSARPTGRGPLGGPAPEGRQGQS